MSDQFKQYLTFVICRFYIPNIINNKNLKLIKAFQFIFNAKVFACPLYLLGDYRCGDKFNPD